MTAPAVSVEGLSYAYPDGTPALEGVGFAIARGEHLAVVGANGAGKSTLLLHLNGLLRGRGRVAIDGLELATGSLAEIRRRVGFAFQDPDDQLFCTTVGEDVAFGPRQQRLPEPEVAIRVAAALAAVDAAGLAGRHPHHLSLGQKKRVAIAGVLACRPSVIVLDEPTSSLDPRARRELIATLAGLGCTLVIATHDLPMVHDLCRRVLVLGAGRVIADGPPERILADRAVLAAAHLD